MGFLIGFLTLVMVLDCAALILLVLIQLPKKEAGAGLAFGGGATDALFGAGSGNVLTQVTKYAATTFFILAVVLSMLQGWYHRRGTSQFEKGLNSAGPLAPAAAPANVRPAAAANPAQTPSQSPAVVTTTNVPAAVSAESTNVPATPATNVPAPAAPK